MSDLLSALSAAARALDAQRYGLDVTGQNIANVNTPGFTRRSLTLAAVPPVDARSAGGGVDAVGVTASRAWLLDARLQREQPNASREAAIATELAGVESALGRPGASLDASLTHFYDAFASLAQEPTSTMARQLVAVQGRELTLAFRETAGRIETAQRDADRGVRAAIDQVNGLTRLVASLNVAIANAAPGSADTLRDEQGVAVAALTELIDVGVIARTDGGVDVSTGNGRALVAGEHAYALQVTSLGPSGFADISSGSASVTAEIAGGRIGGLLHVRDVLSADYLDRLDRLASGVAISVNTQHRAGFDLAGTTGGDFFTPPAAVAGAAASLQMNAAIEADVSLIAAAGSPSAGDNATARAIAGQRTAPITGGSANPFDTWGELVYRVATDARVADEDYKSAEAVIHQLHALREQIAGVSLDEEAAMMLRFQRAYEANARFFTAIDQLLDTFMSTVAR